MKVDILASGSKGNCIAIRSGETTILIDAGIAKTKIEKRLLEVGIRADHIAAIFITHAHGDHTKGLPLANKYRIPVYATYGEWKDVKNVELSLKYAVRAFKTIEIGGMAVSAFPVHHDAYEPLGYTVQGDKKASVCLDTGRVDPDMLKVMQGSDIYIIEANHDPDLVEASDYPPSVQARILSDIGHLSNEQTAAALTKLVQGRGERIYLTHLSSSNNMPALAQRTTEFSLKQKGYVNGKHYFLEVI